MRTTYHKGPRSRVLATFTGLALLIGACGRHEEVRRPAQAERAGSGAVVGTPGAASSAAEASNTSILEWNSALYDSMRADSGYDNPMAAARWLAILHLAQHDAVNAVTSRYEAYAFTDQDPGADPAAAAAAAAHTVLLSAFPKLEADLQARLTRSLSGSAEPARSRGVELGRRAARAILDRRRGDGSDTPVKGDYRPRSAPGAYDYVPPFDLAAAPGWRSVKPFALSSPAQFRPAPPPALDSAEYTKAFQEVKTVGGKQSQARTPEQSAYAKFWWEFSEIGWNRIARTVSAERELGLADTARLFALLNMALSDAYVAGWDAKFHYDFWRPYTAIRKAKEDGNPATEPDAEWVSAETTPPVQDYPSTHSALGDAGAEILAAVFGDATPFTVASTTGDPPSATRSFPGFERAADENADSRVVAGLHFRFSCEEGQKLGRAIGRYTIEHHLEPR